MFSVGIEEGQNVLSSKSNIKGDHFETATKTNMLGSRLGETESLGPDLQTIKFIVRST